MASAKNKKAAATKKTAKTSAPKKVVKQKKQPKTAVKKVVVKSAPAKKVGKKVASTPNSKPGSKSKSEVKKGKVLPKKANSKETAVARKVKVAAPSTKSSSKVAVKKIVPAASEKKGKAAPIIAKPAKSAPGKAGAGDKVNASKTSPVGKIQTKPQVKSKGGDDAPEPLQAKAEKVIKELEETMDLSKMRPRIQAGPSPRALPKLNAPLPKLPEPVNTTKVKFQLEFEFRSSPKILFTSLSDSSGLAGWFADEVKTKDDVYTFIWEGGESRAKLIAMREYQLVRFQWLDDTDETYFQFEIKEDDITSDVALLITDFANPGERESTIRLWESQVQKLRMILGSL